MDSVTLRKTHFKLGDYANPYTTTTMEQNKLIEGKGPRVVASLDNKLKEDLRKSHFQFGNFNPNYNTVSKSEFYNKSGIKNDAKTQFTEIERSLRSHNYVLGSDKPDYKSETSAKYTKPDVLITDKGAQTISTEELQKSHYNFGNNNDSWTTTQQLSYYPKVKNKK